MNTHEDLARTEAVEPTSEKFFGLTFFILFLAVALLPLINGRTPHLWAFALSAFFLVLALFAPGLLRPANKLWLRFGALLHSITSPIILGVMFFFMITPIGFFMRVSGKDFLRLTFNPSVSTYWIRREPPGPENTSLHRQF